MTTSTSTTTSTTTSDSDSSSGASAASSPKELIRVMLVDDQVLLRVGLKTIIDTEPGMSVVAEAASGDEAMAIYPGARPDVILMDIQMAGMDGIATTAKIVAAPNPPAIVMLTTFHRDDYLFGALRAGAVGFLLKTSPPELIAEAIRTAAEGNGLLAPELTRQVITAAVKGGPREQTASDALAEKLTDREREILMQIATGASNAEIAETLYIGEATVRTHLSSLFAKLGVVNRVNAAIWAFRHGLVTDDE
jgi:DNA-binding NarL/FixJ family response regulator